jgi:HAD superfamily hydrolase (TIGR01509 family)
VIRGVIFDLDGTLFDGDYDWPAIKRRLGLAPDAGTILEHIDALPPDQRRDKERLLRDIEEHATKNGRLKPGAAELLGDLRARGMKLALVTNNHLECVEQVVSRYALSFDLVQTRESGLYKPSGAALRRAAHELGIAPGQLIAVGDNELDNRAAHAAGMAVVIIINSEVEMFRGRCDHALRDLGELRELLERLLPAAD